MKTNLLLLIVIIASRGISQTNPVASFTLNKTTGCNPLTVEFINNSSNATSYLWDFGNGDTSTLKNPSTIYFNSGNYSVKLVAFFPGSQTDTLIMQNAVAVFQRPVADFTVVNNHSCANGNPVIFTNNSSHATNYTWDFGDGITSSQQNPSHIYTAPGTYSVALIAQNSIGCSDVKIFSQYVIISSKPSADFFADTTKFCTLNHQFVFTPLTANASDYNWNFGDGSSTSSLANPSHTYSVGGKHDVTLSITGNNGCGNTLTKSNYISVSQELFPVFSANNNIGCAPLNVDFSSSLSSSLSYLWNFGDGNTSGINNPSHLYNDTGIYSVSLTVKDANNCSFTYTEDSLVNTNDPLKAGFTESAISGCAPLNVDFTDNSMNAASWNWDFGDGTNSTLKNPSHKYLNPGLYSVSLVVQNANNCESAIQKMDLINVTGPVSGFSLNDSVGCSPLAVSFSDSSVNAVQWQWDFGDGTSSSLKNPSHTFSGGGLFSVKLITFSANGCSDTLIKNDLVQTFDPNISFNLVDTISACNEISASFNGSALGTNFWLWDFGDGNTSSLPDPIHTFSIPGVYNVSLTTQISHGCTITINNYNVYEILGQNIDFGYSVGTCPDFTATFVDSSTEAVSWIWDFGDGASSSVQNPSHAYSNVGIYSVALTISTSEGCTYSTMKNNIIVFNTCAADSGGGGGLGGGGSSGGSGGFDSTNNTYQVKGCSPFNVYFSNPFDSAVSYLWYFGDGDSSTLEDPLHIYSLQGLYDVVLLVRYPDNSTDTLIRNDFIKVNKVKADFSVQQNNNCSNSTVILTNNSLNAISHLWKFGDGDSSIIPDPVHTYSEDGNYLIKLKSSDNFGCNSQSVKNIITGAPLPLFNMSENICINDSTLFSSNLDNFYSYLWDFGDGDFSTEESPVHAYDSGGTFLVSLTVFDSAGCSFNNVFPGDITVSNPLAGFTVSDTSGCNTLMVTFNDASTGADTWNWDFGDGVGSTLQNPSHIYTTEGIYSVTLLVEKNGCSGQKMIPDAIQLHNSMADFSFIQNTLCFPVTAAFSDSSMDAVSWNWNFGDGFTDTVQNPVHIFSGDPSGNISLSIIDANGCSASVSKGNIDKFISSVSASVSEGCDTLHVNFTDQSNGAISWEWDFGDGSVSNLQNPAHFYADSGSFNVTLIAESPDGCKDTSVFPNYINVYKVTAGFNSPSILSGCNPLLVNFLDNSLNATQWNWNFGDGSSSMQKNPWHIYTLPAINNISLIASNDFGCSDTMIEINFVNVTGPVASFGLSSTEGCLPAPIQFWDASFNNAINLTWYFGDGDTSSTKNPFHLYDSIGTFTVSLLAEDTSGCSSFYTFPQNISVNPVPQYVIGNFTTSGCQPLNIFFDGKLLNSDSAFWNFGDGTFSHSPSEGHIFDAAGVFQPILISSNNYGCTDTFYYPPVTVFPTPVADFSAVNAKGCSPLSVNFINNSGNLDNAAYQWNFGNGEASDDTSPSSIYEVGGMFDVSLIVTNGPGCSDTMTRNNFVLAYDNLSPVPSEVVVATVSSNVSVHLVWKESNAVDFEKYILYRKDNLTGQFFQIAVFSDMDISGYTDYGLNTINNFYCYKLQTVDFCGNAKSLNELIEYCTINVTAKPDSARISVRWTPYLGCSIDKYEILRANPGQENFELIASVDKNTLNFEDTAWYCFSEYSYKIKALDVCGNPVNSFSDTSVAKANSMILSNQKVEVVRSTVIDNSAVFTEWRSPEFAPEKVAGYKIYRSSGNLKFEMVGILPSTIHSYTDNDVDVSKQNYFYKVETVNVCGIKSLLSNNSSSVLLEAERDNYEVKLKWTPYKHWENGVEQYIIERQDENGNWQIVKIVDGNSTEFRDSLIVE